MWLRRERRAGSANEPTKRRSGRLSVPIGLSLCCRFRMGELQEGRLQSADLKSSRAVLFSLAPLSLLKLNLSNGAELHRCALGVNQSYKMASQTYDHSSNPLKQCLFGPLHFLPCSDLLDSTTLTKVATRKCARGAANLASASLSLNLTLAAEMFNGLQMCIKWARMKLN